MRVARVITVNSGIYKKADAKVETYVYASIFQEDGSEIIIFADNARTDYALTQVFAPLMATDSESGVPLISGDKEAIKGWVGAINKIVPEVALKFLPLANRFEFKYRNRTYKVTGEHFASLCVALGLAFLEPELTSNGKITVAYKHKFKAVTKAYVAQFKN